MEQLSLESLKPSSLNPRRDVGDVSEIAASIKSVGLLEPLIVSPNGEGFEIICGHRRAAAAKAAGLAMVPVIVRELDEKGRIEAMLVENLQRADLSPVEEAMGYKRLVELGVKQSEIASRVGRTQGHVSKRISLLDAPDVALKALDAGRISVEDALELRKLKDMPKRAADVVREPGYGGVKRAVEQQLREHERDTQRGDLEQRLKAEGVRLIPKPAHNDKVMRLGKGYGELALAPAKHRKEPCHAAFIDQHYSWRGGRDVVVVKAVAACTDPKRHTAKGASKLKLPKGAKLNGSHREPTAHDKKQAETRKQLKEAAKLRRPFLAKIVQGRGAKTTEAFECIAWEMIRQSACRGTKLVTELLGVDDNTDIRELASKSPDDLRRVALACAMASVEESIKREWSDWSTADAHFALLGKQGYETSEIEDAKLAGEEKR